VDLWETYWRRFCELMYLPTICYREIVGGLIFCNWVGEVVRSACHALAFLTISFVHILQIDG
jgi:hypothetical protein